MHLAGAVLQLGKLARRSYQFGGKRPALSETCVTVTGLGKQVFGKCVQHREPVVQVRHPKKRRNAGHLGILLRALQELADENERGETQRRLVGEEHAVDRTGRALCRNHTMEAMGNGERVARQHPRVQFAGREIGGWTTGVLRPGRDRRNINDSVYRANRERPNHLQFVIAMRAFHGLPFTRDTAFP